MLLTGYAYETVANKAIIAGKTSGSDEASRVNPADPGSSRDRSWFGLGVL
jgi:hypothetical protein